MRRIGTIGVVAIVVVLASLARTQGKTDPTLDKLAQEFAAAFNAKDAAKVAAFYTEDAVLMPPNRPMVKGRANIEADYKRVFGEGVTNLQLRPMESVIAGTQAFEAGTSSVTVKGGGSSMLLSGVGGSGAAVTEQGKYVVVYKRVGADWKIAYDSFSGDQPPPAVKK